VIPNAIDALESAAEDCGEAVRAKDWSRAERLAMKLRRGWPEAKSDADAHGGATMAQRAIEDAIGKLAMDVAAHASQAAQVDANAVSLSIADLFELYAPAVPPEVLRLDARFRGLQIDADFASWGTAASDAGSLAASWQRVKPLVASAAPKRAGVKGAATLVADMDGTIDALSAALKNEDGAGAAEQAERGLDLVDVVESVLGP
jgi:hypothetical protein